METTWQIMVASSELEDRRRITEVLMRLGLDPICVTSVAQCRELLTKEQIHLIFCERFLPDGDYSDIVAASQDSPSQPFVVLACHHNVSEYRKAITRGVFEVISEKCHPSEVEWMVIRTKRDYDKRMQARLGPSPQENVPTERITGGIAKMG